MTGLILLAVLLQIEASFSACPLAGSWVKGTANEVSFTVGVKSDHVFAVRCDTGDCSWTTEEITVEADGTLRTSKSIMLVTQITCSRGDRGILCELYCDYVERRLAVDMDASTAALHGHGPLCPHIRLR